MDPKTGANLPGEGRTGGSQPRAGADPRGRGRQHVPGLSAALDEARSELESLRARPGELSTLRDVAAVARGIPRISLQFDHRIRLDAALAALDTLGAALPNDTYTRAELNAALEGLRVNVTDEVTDDVCGRIRAWLRRLRDEEPREEIAEVYERIDLEIGDGEWRREARRDGE